MKSISVNSYSTRATGLKCLQHWALTSLVALAGLLGTGPVGAAPVLKVTRGCTDMFGTPFTDEVAQSLIGGWISMPNGCFQVLIRTYATVLELTPTENGSLNCASTRTGASVGSVCTATPDPGYTHGVWGGDECTGSAATPCILSNVISGKTVSATFTAIPGYVPTGPVVQILIDPLTPTTLYSALDGGGVYTKVGAGHWTAATTQPTNLNVKALAVKSDSSILFAATDGAGVFKSLDAGVTWAACANTNLTNPNLRSLALSGASLYAGTTAGVFVSTDACASWTAINTGMP